MKNQTTLTAYLPIQISYVKDFDISFDTLEEICNLEGNLEFPLDEFGNITPKIIIIETDEIENDIVKNILEEILPKHKLARPDYFLKITTTVDYAPNTEGFVDSSGNKIEISIDKADEYYKHYILSLFNKRIYDLVLIANIANPGSVGLFKGIIMQDDQLGDKTDIMNAMPIQEAVTLVQSAGWPKMKKLDFLTAWKWAISKEGFLDGYGEDQITRALSSLTYIFDQNIELQAPSLFWALVGVEALYVKGQGSLTQQVREKTGILLGPPTSYKKKLNNMYDYRSRLVHGDLNFPGRHNLREEQEGEHIQELYEAIGIAIAILISTLQEIILRNWNGIDFTYSVNDISTE